MSGVSRAEATRLRPVIGVLAAVALVAAAPDRSMAQTAPALPAAQSVNAASEPASASVVINLIRLLVQQGVLTEDKANALIRQAQDEAVAAARAQQARTAVAPTATAAATAATSPTTPGSVHVMYVPEIVKQQITAEVKQEVMQQAKAENWAAPGALPEWTKRFHLYGDFRLRQEWDVFDKRNAPQIANFSALDSGTPFDILHANGVLPPTLDTTQDRERTRVRARLGLNVDVADGITAGIRLATGNTTNPVTTNQTLGTDLNKDNFLLDLAYLQYQPRPWATLWLGRMPNPWFYTDLVWSPELNFDGVAAQIAPSINDKIKPFVTAGAFPVENTAFNFPDNNFAGGGSSKAASRDKFLYAAQAGLGWRPAKDYNFKFAAAYYYFSNIDGRISDPCPAYTNVSNTGSGSAVECDTDNSRPGSLQQGNTLMAIRNVDFPADTTSIYQFYGLASSFHELNFTGQFDFSRLDPVHVILDGDFVTNLGFNSARIAALDPVNNRGPSPDGGATLGPFAGGANGFQARLTVGHPQINELWDWNVFGAYKYLESDAVLDAFTDSDFHLGGTNAKGYIVGGNLGIAHNVYVTGKWLSASQISGDPYAVDVVQLDLNARF
jgi:hypothetical protein